MLFNQEVNIQLGNKNIVQDSLITIDKDIKYAIIGPNGIGKTTLMNHIYNNLKDDYHVLYTKNKTVTELLVQNHSFKVKVVPYIARLALRELGDTD